jgi:hypothetical protein
MSAARAPNACAVRTSVPRRTPPSRSFSAAGHRIYGCGKSIKCGNRGSELATPMVGGEDGAGRVIDGTPGLPGWRISFSRTCRGDSDASQSRSSELSAGLDGIDYACHRAVHRA